MNTVVFKIHGLDCADEVALLRSELAPLTGVEDLAFDILNARMTVVCSDAVTTDRMIAAVARTGMRAEPWRDSAKLTKSVHARVSGKTVMTLASGLLLLAGYITHVALSGWHVATGAEESHEIPLRVKVLYLAAVVTGAWYVAPKALRTLLRLRPDMNLLMIVAVAGAIAINDYFESATVAFLFSLSLALESWSVGRARNAIAALMSLSPDIAKIVRPGGSEVDVNVHEVAIGSRVVVLPGEKFPLDGQISTGETTVDQAPITGESLPVSKAKGDQVFAGTINQDGAVEMVTTKAAEDTTLARVVRMVGDAQSKRSPSEQWVERFAQIYTPMVMALAIAVMLLPPLMLHGAWSTWFYNGLVLLVIACPCALVISTPVSIVAAIAAAARHGVLVKGGPHIESPAALRVIALDKTGTLTEGRPEVASIVPLSGFCEDDVLTLAAAIESRSEHPLARAVVRAAAERGVRPLAAENFQAIKGKGATAMLDGRSVWVGSHRLLVERGLQSSDVDNRIRAIEEQGLSVIVLGEGDSVCGLIGVGDRIRPDARTVVQEMRRAGIEHVVMLTGDNRTTGEAIGREADVDEVHAELLPEEKVEAIDKLVRVFGRVAMVGDGVNDAPAMARAGLGIAMGAAGTDAALETADVALMGDDLRGIPWLIRHSRRTLAIIRQNIFASLGVKVVFALLTLIGYASLWAAITADMGASLLVIFNSLRLLKSKDLSPVANLTATAREHGGSRENY